MLYACTNCNYNNQAPASEDKPCARCGYKDAEGPAQTAEVSLEDRANAAAKADAGVGTTDESQPRTFETQTFGDALFHSGSEAQSAPAEDVQNIPAEGVQVSDKATVVPVIAAIVVPEGSPVNGSVDKASAPNDEAAALGQEPPTVV